MNKVYTMGSTLETLGIFKSGSPTKNDELMFLLDKCEKSSKRVEIYRTLKEFWAKNGDYLSLQYTGAESNISRATKTD